MNGLIFDIQKFAINDGPGIRTSVFLKGCNNRCAWCHNPESLSSQIQIREYPQRCLICRKCESVCPKNAHVFKANKHIFLRENCILCLACVGACPSQALEAIGKEIAAEEVIREVIKDEIFYHRSGGGITITGGEPMVQPEFTKELLVLAKKNGLNTVLQTAGNYPIRHLEPLLPFVDTLMIDIKICDKQRLLCWCGIHWENVRDNILNADKTTDIIVRTPVIGGVNDSIEDIINISLFLKKIKRLVSYELIPYHNIYSAKLSGFGMDESFNFYTPSPETLNGFCKIARSMGIPVSISE